MLDICILGTPRFEHEGRPVAADTRKASALLAYLAVEGPARRDTLAALLWPESADSQARATLRRTLSALRTAMGSDSVETDREQIRLTKHVRTDLAVFRDAISETRRHDHGEADVCHECIPHLKGAVDAYRGDFMAGFSLRDSPEFDDWTRTTAEGLRLEVGRAYERLAAAYAADGDFRSAIEAVTSWLELDPLREPAYRQLMLLYAWSGDGAGATAAYRQCVATLDEELGVDPLEETTELYEAILDNDLPPSPGLRRRVLARPAEKPALPLGLIDRQAELETLFEALGAGLRGRVIRIVGEAWLGKTRLTEELKTEAAKLAVPIVSARGYRAESQLPHGVVAQLLASLVTSDDWAAAKAGVPDWALSEAGAVYPELANPRLQARDDAFGEVRLYDALFKILTSISPVIIVDDAQWADHTSLAFLTFLAHRISTVETLLVITHRPDEDRTLRSLIEATPAPDHLAMVLEPITSAQISGRTHDAETLIHRTGGIPALVAEALEAESTVTVTPSVRRFMEVRLVDLNDLTHQILTAAAVLNGTCDFDLLREVSGRNEEEVVDSVETLVARRILNETVDGGLEFAIDSLETLVYEAANFVRRRLLHRRAAIALQNRPRAMTDAGLATAVAQHLRDGGQDSEAADWYVKAGDLSRRVFAAAEAVASYRAALALGHSDVSHLHQAIGEALLFLGRFNEAHAEFEKAAAHGSGADRAAAEHMIGEANRRLGRLDSALSQFEIAEMGHPNPTALYCDWALALLRSGDRKAAREKADRAVVAAEKGDEATRSRALAILGTVSSHRAESRKALEEALELAGNDPVSRMAALNALGYSYAQTANDDMAMSCVQEALTIASTIGDRHRQAALYNHLADLHHRSGRVSDAESSLTEAVKLFAEVEPGSWEPEVWLLTRW